MKTKIIFATKNAGKMKEIKSILESDTVEVKSVSDEGIDIDVEENGTTFEENALIKARAYAKEVKNAIVLADDSGLEVDYLNKEPGIYSARYMGETTSYRIKNANIIERLQNVAFEDRTARFVCAIAAVTPLGDEFVVRETVEGYIAKCERGENGFGYDPIFYVKEYDCCTAELDPEIKNAISHRGKALRAMRSKLTEKGIM